MASPEFKAQLRKLQTEFVAALPGRVNQIEALWQQWLRQPANRDVLWECYRMVHSLVGSAGSFGYERISRDGRALDHFLAALHKNATEAPLAQARSEFKILFQQLRAAAASAKV